MAGIYVHIPFCKSRCAYCDFFSTTRADLVEDYVAALCREIVWRRNEQLSEGTACEAAVQTIYFGGGTPSTLTPSQLMVILECIYTNYRVAPDAEVTLEMNPDDVEGERTYGTASSPLRSNSHHGKAISPLTLGSINRVSLGIQTFDDSLLSLIRRRHNAQGAINAVKRLQDAGIKNISIDLIYGLPSQTQEQWQRDLDTAFSLGVQHLSAYALSYEPGTELSRWREEGRVKEADEELSVTMYAELCRRARQAGFEHYEISNFALTGFRSRHNSSYWNGNPYLGFGPGAHSYDGNRLRRANSPDLDLYLNQWSCADAGQTKKAGESGLSGLSGKAVTVERLSDADLFDEVVMCSLRTSRGISLGAISQRFGQERLDYLLHMAAHHIQASRLVLADGRLRLSEKALMTSDDIMSDLMA